VEPLFNSIAFLSLGGGRLDTSVAVVITPVRVGNEIQCRGYFGFVATRPPRKQKGAALESRASVNWVAVKLLLHMHVIQSLRTSIPARAMLLSPVDVASIVSKAGSVLYQFNAVRSTTGVRSYL